MVELHIIVNIDKKRHMNTVLGKFVKFKWGDIIDLGDDYDNCTKLWTQSEFPLIAFLKISLTYYRD
jgi:hypothetical protein